jgi:hypothetical protein
MVRPRVVVYSTMDFGIRIARALCTEFPDCPFGMVFLVEELDKSVGGISVGSLRVCRGRARGGND